MSASAILGLILVIIGSFVFLPQVYQVIKTKNTEGLSLVSYISYVFSVGLWCFYASFIGNVNAYALNIIVFVTSIPIYYYLFKNIGRKKYFLYYIVVNIVISVSSIVMIITRTMNVWGPLVGSSAKDVARPIWFTIISWVTSIAASAIAGASFFPQVVHSIRKRSVKVNIWTMLILGGTQGAWCIYWILYSLGTGVSFGEWLPGLLSGGFTAALQLILIVSWFIFKEYKKKA